jgi:hypothetical protein
MALQRLATLLCDIKSFKRPPKRFLYMIFNHAVHVDVCSDLSGYVRGAHVPDVKVEPNVFGIFRHTITAHNFLYLHQTLSELNAVERKVRCAMSLGSLHPLATAQEAS